MTDELELKFTGVLAGNLARKFIFLYFIEVFSLFCTSILVIYKSSCTIIFIVYFPSALTVNFKVLDDPLAAGDDSSRVIFLQEASTSNSVISIEVSGSESVAPIPFHISPLTYDEYEARFPSMNLNNLFPSRPIDPAGG